MSVDKVKFTVGGAIAGVKGEHVALTCGNTAAVAVFATTEEERQRLIHLIAASPHLLALARDYLASGDECVRGDDSCVEPDSCGVCDLKRSAQAAIARAEGRE